MKESIDYDYQNAERFKNNDFLPFVINDVFET